MESVEIQQVVGHELALLTPEVRQSRTALERLLDPEFREIGASGRSWTRPEIVSALVEAGQDVDPVPTREMKGVFITPDVILLTYISDPGDRAALRSSLWRRRSNGWQMLHHQGTPAAKVSALTDRTAAAHVEPLYASLPQRYVGSGVLITDEAGGILMVEPTYKSNWEIPGGVTEKAESTSGAARRECTEELGIAVDVGRPLVIEHQTVPGRGDSLMFVYDGGILPQDVPLTLPAAELHSYRFVAASDLDDITSPRLANRLRVALRARTEGTLIELHNGVRVALSNS